MRLFSFKTPHLITHSRLSINNLFLRALSSAVLIPLIIWIINGSNIIFYCFIVAVAVLMLVEWNSIINRHKHKLYWRVAAVLYTCIFFFSFLVLKGFHNGDKALLWLVITIWGADTAAFIVGKLIGGPKFAPKISPAKTWAGFCGAIGMSCIIGIMFAYYLSVRNVALFVSTSVLLGALSQASDLLESWIKRKAGIKDSGRLIPGHGGILDRTDSFILTAPTLALLLLFFEDLYF